MRQRDPNKPRDIPSGISPTQWVKPCQTGMSGGSWPFLSVPKWGRFWLVEESQDQLQQCRAGHAAPLPGPRGITVRFGCGREGRTAPSPPPRGMGPLPCPPPTGASRAGPERQRAAAGAGLPGCPRDGLEREVPCTQGCPNWDLLPRVRAGGVGRGSPMCMAGCRGAPRAKAAPPWGPGASRRPGRTVSAGRAGSWPREPRAAASLLLQDRTCKRLWLQVLGSTSIGKAERAPRPLPPPPPPARPFPSRARRAAEPLRAHRRLCRGHPMCPGLGRHPTAGSLMVAP